MTHLTDGTSRRSSDENNTSIDVRNVSTVIYYRIMNYTIVPKQLIVDEVQM